MCAGGWGRKVPCGFYIAQAAGHNWIPFPAFRIDRRNREHSPILPSVHAGRIGLNGNPALSSFADYRFRSPNLMLMHESFEHSVWSPFGFAFLADQGKVALARGDVDFQDLKHSFASGITLRAGGFPEVFLLFAWGGGEGSHTTASMNTSLLGGSARLLYTD